MTWEPRRDVEARAARLLPGLFLARVDGKSPVEYVTADADRERVRCDVAVPLARADPARSGMPLRMSLEPHLDAMSLWRSD